MTRVEKAFLISSIRQYFNEPVKRLICGIMVVLMVAASVLPAKQVRGYPYEGEFTSGSQTDTTETVDAMRDYPATTDLDSNIREVSLVGEVESMRTESTKTFQRVDGSYVMALYKDAVHYQKEGKWEEIDNTLIFDENDSTYKNRKNLFSVSFPESLEKNKQIKLSMGDYEVAWTVLDIEKSSAQFSESGSRSSDMRKLSGISQDVFYQDIMNGVDLQYTLSGTQLKEYVILEKYSKDISISFEYSVRNLVFDEKEGTYAFLDEKGHTVFCLSSLFAFDAGGETTEKIEINVLQMKEDVFQIALSLDDQWASQASYPVTIDPSITIPSTNGYFRDTYVREGSTSNYSGSAFLYCGDTLLYSYLGYINFTVPTFLTNFDVIFSTLYLNRSLGADDLFLHELPSYIPNLGGLTWANRPIADTRLLDYAVVSSANGEYQLDITTSVDKWNKLGLTEMPGFELSSQSSLLRFYSIDSASSPPMIEIGFIDSNGIKDYWTYNSQDVSHAGIGYISDFTQDLFFVRNDISFQTDLQTLGVSFVLNNHLAISNTPNLGYGTGWNISYNMRIAHDDALGIDYSVDFTGNRINYYPSTCDSRTASVGNISYTCSLADDGSGTKLVKKSIDSELSERFFLTADNIQYGFGSSSPYLLSISHLDNDLSLTILRDANLTEKVLSVTDERGNQIQFSYGVDGNLQIATLRTRDDSENWHDLEKIYYGYYDSTDFLHDIWYLSDFDQSGDLSLNLSDLKNVDRIVRYDHYASQLLATAYVKFIDEETGEQSIGEEIHYHYYSDTDPAVSYFESFFNSTKYSEVTYDNVPRQTMITDHSGKFVLYSFDRYGHTVNILDRSGKAVLSRMLCTFVKALI